MHSLSAFAVGVQPSGYVCQNHTDIAGQSCDIVRFGNCGVGFDKACDIAELARQCDSIHASIHCNGFNSNGYLKRCVRSSCGAVARDYDVVSCVRTDVPPVQPVPAECAPSPPAPPTPAPSPPTPAPPPPTPAGGRTDCSGVKPPFGSPEKPVPLVDDWYYPPEEASEAASIAHLLLVAIPSQSTAVLTNLATNATATVEVGTMMFNWQLNFIHDEYVVLEQFFSRWSLLIFLKVGASEPLASMRKPVGQLQSLDQPLYYLDSVDADWYCKQDIDPTDWLARLSAEMSDNETTFEAAASVMAPNSDNGFFGNPEELNKWILTDQGTLLAEPFPRGNKNSPGIEAFTITDFLPLACANAQIFTNFKSGMVGRYLRIIDQGMWDPKTNCGAEIVAVSPPLDAKSPESVALLRVTTVLANNATTIFLRVRANQSTSELLGLDNLLSDGNAFYAAVLSQFSRWGDWIENGALASIPDSDRRYGDMSQALMTAYLNLDRGLIPEYGMGKFANEYNEYLPLDTLALNEALLEWGQQDTAKRYLDYFFQTYINTNGYIIYSLFGCDGDADYGRLISAFVKTVRYSGDLDWASSLISTISNMANVVLQRRQESIAIHPPGHILHGLARGSSEHDICRRYVGRGYFFSVNAWHIRGLLDLHQLLSDYPSLYLNSTWTAMLEEAAGDWRTSLNQAANFTAVRDNDGGGVFFLHPCVGSDCQGEISEPQPMAGGTQDTCVHDGTCFEQMTEDYAVTHTWDRIPNYANFRIFSETLLSNVLEPQYEEALMNFREQHRGTLSGMARFRDVIDDMPVLGYGWSALSHGRLDSFHSLLAGHSANYLSRGTFWGTEQREQSKVVDHKYSNCCGPEQEYGSLCMASSIPVAMWTRWMLVQEDRDAPQIYLARGVPQRWYANSEPFGIKSAPTRFGVVSYMLSATNRDEIEGWVEFRAHPNSTKLHQQIVYAVRLLPPRAGMALIDVRLSGSGTLLNINVQDSTALVEAGGSYSHFNFTAVFQAPSIALI